ncbi:MAG: alpha amylase C-terminal domain-containing protein, partial [Gemmatimonadaceae bacterium]
MFSRRISLCAFVSLIALATPLRAQAPAQTVPFDRANLDTTVKACQDFYQFANGGWLTRAKIPGDYPTYGAFDQLFDQNQEVLRNVLDTAVLRVKSGQYKRGTGEWKVGTFYATCMDTASIERLGATPLKPALDRIAAIKTIDDLKRSLGELDRKYGLVPIADPSTQDSKDAANTIAGLYQGGLSLPNSEYYTKTDTASVNMRAKFTASVARMFQLLGESPQKANADAKTVLAVETEFAKGSRTPIQLRDVVNNYHGMTLRQVDSLTPHFSWAQFYQGLGVPTPAKFDVGQPEFLQNFDAAMNRLDVEHHTLTDPFIEQLMLYEDHKLLVYRRGPLVFAFNFHATNSYTDLRIPVPDAVDYRIVLNTDARE